MTSAEGTYSAEQIDQFLKCPVCLDRYNSPKILPCQHTFCRSPCLEGLCDFRARKIRCPECRAEHFVPYNGVDGFPSNLTISNFLDLPVTAIEPRQESQQESSNKCGICENEADTRRCCHCDKLACESCRLSHQGQMKLDIGRLVNQVRRGIPKLSNSIGDVEQKSELVKQHVEGIKAEVENTIERYIKELRDRQKLLNSELETFLHGEQRNLRLQQENLEVELASISSYCDTTESILNSSQQSLMAQDLVNMKKQCVDYMEQIRHVDTDGPTVPVQTKEVRFTYEGQMLQESIVSFGELVINNPGSSTSAPRNNQQSSQAAQNNSRRPRWGNAQPLHSLYFSSYNETPDVTPRPTPRSQPSTTATVPGLYRRTSSQSSVTAPSPSFYQPVLTSRGSSEPSYLHTSRDNPLRQTVPTPRNQNLRPTGYMFEMSTPEPENIVEEMEQLIESMERNPLTSSRRRAYDHRNSSSIFGRDPFEERVAGLMGGGVGGGGGSRTPVVPRQRPVVQAPDGFFIPLNDTPMVPAGSHGNNRNRPSRPDATETTQSGTSSRERVFVSVPQQSAETTAAPAENLGHSNTVQPPAQRVSQRPNPAPQAVPLPTQRVSPRPNPAPQAVPPPTQRVSPRPNPVPQTAISTSTDQNNGPQNTSPNAGATPQETSTTPQSCTTRGQDSVATSQAAAPRNNSNSSINASSSITATPVSNREGATNNQPTTTQGRPPARPSKVAAKKRQGRPPHVQNKRVANRKPTTSGGGAQPSTSSTVRAPSEGEGTNTRAQGTGPPIPTNHSTVGPGISQSQYDEMPLPSNGGFQRSGTFVRESGPSTSSTNLPVVATDRSMRYDIRL